MMLRNASWLSLIISFFTGTLCAYARVSEIVLVHKEWACTYDQQTVITFREDGDNFKAISIEVTSPRHAQRVADHPTLEDVVAACREVVKTSLTPDEKEKVREILANCSKANHTRQTSADSPGSPSQCAKDLKVLASIIQSHSTESNPAKPSLNYQIAMADVERFVRAIRQSNIRPELVLADLGITSQTVQKHNAALMQDLSKDCPSLAKVIMANGLSFKDDDAFAQAQKHIRFRDGYSGEYIKVSVVGDTPMEIVSLSQLRLGVPWQVRVGNRQWKSYSTELAESLRVFEELLDEETIPRYWRDYWDDDGTFWRRGWCEAATALISRHANDLLNGMDGAREIAMNYSLGNCEPQPNGPDARMLIELKSKLTKAPLIDQVTWSVPFIDGRPAGNWRWAATKYETLERQASTIRWIKTWKRAQKGRVIGSYLADQSEQFPNRVRAAWTGFKLKGDIAGFLILKAKENNCAVVYFSSPNEEQVMLEKLSPDQQIHALQMLGSDDSRFEIATRTRLLSKITCSGANDEIHR
jgi:hypothetical protein